MDFSNWKPRCSSLGYIMVEPRGKSPKELYEAAQAKVIKLDTEYRAIENTSTKTAIKKYDDLQAAKKKRDWLATRKDTIHLSDSCKTHLSDIYTLIKYGRREDVKTKYLEKGTTMEQDAIDLYGLVTGVYYEKNKIQEDNGWITGEMDFIDKDYVNDTKVNWSIFQFNRVIARPIKPIYLWQVKGYCWLFNRKRGRLIYCLLDTPEKMIKQEIKKLSYDFIGTEEDFESASAEIRYNHTYADIPEKERVRVFDIFLEDSDIEKIKTRIDECRKYLNNIEKGIIEDDEEEMEEAA